MVRSELNQILDNDEYILQTLHPYKPRFYFDFYIRTFALVLWVFALTVMIMLAFNISGPYYYIPLGYFVIAFAIVIPLSIVRYNNTIYTITNKRVIVCSSICGTNFTSIKLEASLNVSYKQNLFDRLVGGVGTLTLTNANNLTVYTLPNQMQLCFLINAIDIYKQLQNLANTHIE